MIGAAALSCSLVFNLNLGAPSYEVLMRSDGTKSGTVIVRDIDGPDQRGFAAHYLQRVGDEVVFVSGRAGIGWEPYRTDGTREGTRLIRDFLPGAASSLGSEPASGRIATIGNRAYFDRVDGATPRIVGYDASTNSPFTISGKLISSGISYSPDIVGVKGNSLVLAHIDGISSLLSEWDVVTKKTIRKAEMSGGVSVFGYHSMTFNRYLVSFSHFSGDFGEIYVTTRGRKSMTRLGEIFEAENFHSIRGGVLFTGKTDARGKEVWFTDGTVAGTRVIDLAFGRGSSDPADFLSIGSKTYFTARAANGGRGIWVTDGTSKNTKIIESSTTSPVYSGPRELAAFRGRILYLVDGNLHVMSLPSMKSRIVTYNGLPLTVHAFRSIGDKVVITGRSGRDVGIYSVSAQNMTAAALLRKVDRFSFGSKDMAFSAVVGDCNAATTTARQ